ncbi:hypothetical protein K439DRAFT_1639487 [Ramaria rubella]|nr:hypothetical protein K439DRAFT_1639487 [Ramaria rubella]
MPTQDYDIRANILDAYTRLDTHQLQLFLRLRSLPEAGSHSDLAVRLTEHDLKTYTISSPRPTPPTPLSSQPQRHPSPSSVAPAPRTPHSQILSNLPIDLIAEILDHVGSWELSKAVGVLTSLPRPPEWGTSATCLDRAILSTSIHRVRSTPASPPFTRLGANLLIAFDLRDILDYLWSVESLRPSFKLYFEDSLSGIPTLASMHDRPRILDWWLSQSDITPKAYTSDAVDNACRNISLNALEWWDAKSRPLSNARNATCVTSNGGVEYRNSTHLGQTITGSLSFPPLYTTQSLEAASLKAHIPVLSFFTEHSWPLRPGRSLDMASSAGHVSVLDWWAYESGLEIGKDVKYDKNAVYHASCSGKVDVLKWWKEQSERGKGKGGKGVQMIFDADALVGATRHNKPEVLEWWDKSGLPISYRMCDIEEALEDAIAGGAAARAWWARKGINFRAGDSEWMKMRSLN